MHGVHRPKTKSPLELLYQHEFRESHRSSSSKTDRVANRCQSPTEPSHTRPPNRISIDVYRRRLAANKLDDKVACSRNGYQSIGCATDDERQLEKPECPPSPVLSIYGSEEINDAWFERVAYEIGRPDQELDTFSDSENELLQDNPKDGRLSLLDAEPRDIENPSERIVGNGERYNVDVTVEYLPVLAERYGRSITPTQLSPEKCRTPSPSIETKKPRPKSEKRREHERNRRRRRRQIISRYAAASMQKQAVCAIQALKRRGVE